MRATRSANLIVLVKCTVYEAPHYAIFSSLPPLTLGPNILLNTFSKQPESMPLS